MNKLSRYDLSLTLTWVCSLKSFQISKINIPLLWLFKNSSLGLAEFFKETGSQGLSDMFETSSQTENFCNSWKFLFSEINLSSTSLIFPKFSQHFVSCNFRENVTRFYFLCLLPFIYLVYCTFGPYFLCKFFSKFHYFRIFVKQFLRQFDIEYNRWEYIFEVLK